MSNATPDYSTLKVGGTFSPLNTGTPNSLLQDADPPLFYLLDFVSWVITNYVGTRLVDEARAANVPITMAVAQRYPYNPQQYLAETQFRFPLLAAYRRRTLTGRRTAGWEHDNGIIDLLYVLPTLDAAGAESILPILHAVWDVVRPAVTRGWDPGYAPPLKPPGTPPWPLAGVERIGFGDPLRDGAEGNEYGSLPGAGNLWFPALRMSAYAVERDMPVPAANKFLGGDLTLNVLADDGTRVLAATIAGTNPLPTITSLNVTSGTQAGGTAVTLTGTGFLTGPPLVQFGANYATSVAFNGVTSVTATTPVMSGGGTVDVTLTNRDGQRAILPQSFTFTTP